MQNGAGGGKASAAAEAMADREVGSAERAGRLEASGTSKLNYGHFSGLSPGTMAPLPGVKFNITRFRGPTPSLR